MPKLSALDLAMFVLETRDRPFNVAPLIVLKPPPGARGRFADRLTQRMLARPVGPPLNYRLRKPIVGVASLEIDPDIVVARHVHRLTLPAPGSMTQLCEAVCKLHVVPLDRSRPLWEMHVIDGIEGGAVALFGKVHHGIADGRTFVKIMSAWLATSPKARTVRALWEGLRKVPRSGRAKVSPSGPIEHALGGMVDTAMSAIGLGRILGRLVLNKFGLSEAEALPMVKVSNAFHGASAAARTFAFCTLPLAEIKTVCKAQAATVNDVLLTVLDCAMVRLLTESGELPRTPLVVDMPLALTGSHGSNQFAVLQLPLGAPEGTPAERLAAIRIHTGWLKDLVQRESAETVMLYTALVHAVPVVAEVLGVKGELKLSNAIVSNAFGAPEKRYLMGAEVTLALPVSMIAAGQMLNITAVTVADRMHIGFLANPVAVLHVDRLAAYTLEAFAEVQLALGAPATAQKARRAPRPNASTRSVGKCARK